MRLAAGAWLPTMGRGRLFKGLAWGLASRGVAVLRADKVTFAHPTKVNADMTVVDEYIPHALAAIHLLREHPAIDAGRVFLLGHSLGGTVAPRTAALEPSVAGLVMMAGSSQPLHWTAVRQARYMASLEPESAILQRAIEALTAQARMVDSPDLSPSTPSSELPLGAPASYWLDLRAYQPVEVAAALGQPILILQGGRDFRSPSPRTSRGGRPVWPTART